MRTFILSVSLMMSLVSLVAAAAPIPAKVPNCFDPSNKENQVGQYKIVLPLYKLTGDEIGNALSVFEGGPMTYFQSKTHLLPDPRLDNSPEGGVPQYPFKGMVMAIYAKADYNALVDAANATTSQVRFAILAQLVGLKKLNANISVSCVSMDDHGFSH